MKRRQAGCFILSAALMISASPVQAMAAPLWETEASDLITQSAESVTPPEEILPTEPVLYDTEEIEIDEDVPQTDDADDADGGQETDEQADDSSDTEAENDEAMLDDLASEDETTVLSPQDETNLMLQACEEIRASLLAGETEIKITDYNINRSTAVQFKHIGYYCPYADGTNIKVSLSYYSSGKYAYLTITNNLSADETAAWIDEIDTHVAELSSLIADPSLSMEDQALILHDYMCAHYHYDTTYADIYPSILLTQQDGVCQSYSYLFQYIMNKAGNECYTTTSSSMTHAWNILGIDGQYYHLDVTWDDPIQDNYGMAGHNYFLLSDTAVQDSDHNHSGWDLADDLVCSDSSYENAYYTGAISPVVCEGEERYYVDGNGLEEYNTADSSVSLIDDLGKWCVWGTGAYYTRKYAGLFSHNGKLFFNTAEEIKSYDPSSGEEAVIAAPDTSSGYIYGCVYEGDAIWYSLQTTPSVAYSSKNLQSAEITEPKAAVITEQPVGTQAVLGDTVSYSVQAEHAVSYQWYYSKDGGGKWKALSDGATMSGTSTDTLTFRLTSGRNRYSYHCVITGENGETVVTDTVENQHLAILTQPESTETPAGQQTTFTVEAQNASAYQWYYRKTGETSWHKLTDNSTKSNYLTGSTAETITMRVTATRQTYKYRCRIAGTDGSALYTDIISACPQPVVTVQPQSVKAAKNSSVTLHAEAKYTTAYQWQYQKSGSDTWSKLYDGTSLEGAATDTVTFTATSTRLGYSYRCRLTAADGTFVYTDVVTIR